jgi:hypothetical protein
VLEEGERSRVREGEGSEWVIEGRYKVSGTRLGATIFVLAEEIRGEPETSERRRERR